MFTCCLCTVANNNIESQHFWVECQSTWVHKHTLVLFYVSGISIKESLTGKLKRPRMSVTGDDGNIGYFVVTTIGKSIFSTKAKMHTHKIDVLFNG